MGTEGNGKGASFQLNEKHVIRSGFFSKNLLQAAVAGIKSGAQSMKLHAAPMKKAPRRGLPKIRAFF
jgi:hypothetical protein